VETVFVGRDRLYNRRFLQMRTHYLVDPVACTPASGWEKGQVENQVGLVRERFFTPRLLHARAGYRRARPVAATLQIQLATHGRSIQMGHERRPLQ